MAVAKDDAAHVAVEDKRKPKLCLQQRHPQPEITIVLLMKKSAIRVGCLKI